MCTAALVLAAALALAFAAGAEEARPRFYRWTDAEGVVHYTNDLSLVPESARAQSVVPRAAPAPPTPRPPVETAPPAPPPAEPPPLPPADAATPDVEAGASAPSAVAAPPTLELEQIAAEDSPDAVRLKQLIAEDREQIKRMLAEPGADGPRLAANPDLGEVAARLARHQAELEALRQEPSP